MQLGSADVVQLNHDGYTSWTLIGPIWLVAWLSGNALVSINEVTLRQARLVLGWVTV